MHKHDDGDGRLPGQTRGPVVVLGDRAMAANVGEEGSAVVELHRDATEECLWGIDRGRGGGATGARGWEVGSPRRMNMTVAVVR